MWFVACTLFSSCGNFDNSAGSESSAENDKSIVILFESDSHCELSGYPNTVGAVEVVGGMCQLFL